MNGRTEPILVKPSGVSTWRPHFFSGAYIGAIAVAMMGWTIALSWAAFSFVRVIVNQFT
jgi:hypothetical protein